MSKIISKRWSPYLAGTSIGLLSWFSFITANKALGVSTTFVRAAGAIESTVAPEHVRESAYFAKYLVGKPAFEWQFALVIFLFIGALLASKLSKSAQCSGVPSVWKKRFGGSRPKRNLAAFLGGFLVLFGARLAGGCTSGHGISGGLQLATSGWVFFATIFVVGIATAHLLYGTKN